MSKGASDLILALSKGRILKETLPQERRRKFSVLRANPLGSLIMMARNPVVIGFLAVIFVAQLGSQSHQTVWAYHTELVFAWDELQIGLSVALFGIMLMIVRRMFHFFAVIIPRTHAAVSKHIT